MSYNYFDHTVNRKIFAKVIKQNKFLPTYITELFNFSKLRDIENFELGWDLNLRRWVNLAQAITNCVTASIPQLYNIIYMNYFTGVKLD